MSTHLISVLTSFFLVSELVIFILFHFKHGWKGLKAESHLWNVKKKRKKNQDKDNSLKNTFVWDVLVGMLIRFYFVSISTNSWSLFCQGFTFTLIRNQKGMPVSLHYLLTRKIGPPYHHQCRGGFLIGCLLITGAWGQTLNTKRWLWTTPPLAVISFGCCSQNIVWGIGTQNYSTWPWIST